MRAISIKMPWAWAILHGKGIENRPVRWPLGEYALHASQVASTKSVPTQVASDWLVCYAMAKRAGLCWTTETIGPLSFEDMRRMSGAIIGVLRVTECVTEHSSPFFVGPVGLVLADVRPIKPVYCKGALGAWTVPADVECQVREQLGGER